MHFDGIRIDGPKVFILCVQSVKTVLWPRVHLCNIIVQDHFKSFYNWAYFIFAFHLFVDYTLIIARYILK